MPADVQKTQQTGRMRAPRPPADPTQALQATVLQLLGPLARLAVARGLKSAEAKELLKQAYVHAALAAEQAPGQANVSRVATSTGLTRREVTPCRRIGHRRVPAAARRQHNCSRAGWPIASCATARAARSPCRAAARRPASRPWHARSRATCTRDACSTNCCGSGWSRTMRPPTVCARSRSPSCHATTTHACSACWVTTPATTWQPASPKFWATSVATSSRRSVRRRVVRCLGAGRQEADQRPVARADGRDGARARGTAAGRPGCRQRDTPAACGLVFVRRSGARRRREGDLR
jgi:hypothetical protein